MHGKFPVRNVYGWQAIKIRGKLLIYNVRKGQHVSVPLKLKLFDSKTSNFLFCSLFLLFFFCSNWSSWYRLIFFFFLFLFLQKKKRHCEIADPSTRIFRNEDSKMCERVGRKILSGNFKWNFPVLWGEVNCNRCSTYTIVQFSVYPDLHPKIRRNFLRLKWNEFDCKSNLEEVGKYSFAVIVGLKTDVLSRDKRIHSWFQSRFSKDRCEIREKGMRINIYFYKFLFLNIYIR